MRRIRSSSLQFQVALVCLAAAVALVWSLSMARPLEVAAAALTTISSAHPTFTAIDHPVRPPAFFGARSAASGAGFSVNDADSGTGPSALPTNRWWLNAVLDTGDQPIVTLPYSLRLVSAGSPLYSEVRGLQRGLCSSSGPCPLRVSSHGVFASLPIKESSDRQVIMPWRPDLLITARDERHEETSTSVNVSDTTFCSFEQHQLVRDDLLSMRVQWKRKGGGGERAAIQRNLHIGAAVEPCSLLSLSASRLPLSLLQVGAWSFRLFADLLT